MSPFLILTSIFVALNFGKCGSQAQAQAYPPPYPVGQVPPPRGLGFQESVSQARRQFRSFYAQSIPVKESISNMEEYYIDLEEEGLRNRPQANNLTRKPCKVLPDPQPGLVNPKLIDPVYKYHPIYKNEKFFGEFAPPVKFEYPTRPMDQNSPINRNYVDYQYRINPNNPANNLNYPNYPNNQYANNPNYPNNYNYNYNPNNYNQNQNSNPNNCNQNSNPFNGYQGQYSANSEYFEAETFTPPAVSATTITRTASFNTSIINITSWQSQLSVDYSLRMASLSSALVANSAALSSMSVSAELMSMSMVWAAKEASLNSKWAAYAATATATITATRHSWHW